MPTLVWDSPGDRVYESGLDKGVLYLPDGSAVPWNGLTSIIEHFDKSTEPVYYDGMKIQDLVSLGDFSATMKAITYPEEFIPLEGSGQFRSGMFMSDQPPQVFGLCYRHRVGDDVQGDEAGHKIHLIYNVTTIPGDKTYASVSDDPSLVEFEWTITAIPEETPGFRPTAHIVFDSRTFDPLLMEDLESILYGDLDVDALLLPMPDLITFIQNWYRVKVVDNGDGTWTATADRDGFISFLDFPTDAEFQLKGVNALYITDDEYQLSDTIDLSQVPQIGIEYDGASQTWTATTEFNNVIVYLTSDTVEIRNATITYIDADTYEISDTSE